MSFSFAFKKMTWLVHLPNGDLEVLRGLDVEKALAEGWFDANTPIRAAEGSVWTQLGALAEESSPEPSSLSPTAYDPAVRSERPLEAPVSVRRPIRRRSWLKVGGGFGALAALALLGFATAHFAPPPDTAVAAAPPSHVRPVTEMRDVPERVAREGHVAERAFERAKRRKDGDAVRQWKSAIRELQRRARGDGLVRSSADAPVSRWDPLGATF